MLKFIKYSTLFALSLFTTLTFANSGKGIVSHFEAFSAPPGDNQTDGFIYLTNIAAEPITVTITVYDSDGRVIKEQDNNSNAGIIKTSNATNYSEGTTYTAKFDLGANKKGLCSKVSPVSLWPKKTMGTHIAVNTDGAVKLNNCFILGPIS